MSLQGLNGDLVSVTVSNHQRGAAPLVFAVEVDDRSFVQVEELDDLALSSVGCMVQGGPSSCSMGVDGGSRRHKALDGGVVS